MALLALLGLALFALLVFIGRRPARLTPVARFGRVLFSALAAVAAVASALRGGWLPSLVLVLFSAVLAGAARAPASAGRQRQESDMSLAQARSILGVGEAAGPEEIVAAYRRLMQRAHPDHGGSTGLAAQLNAARDRLLTKGRPGAG